MTDSSLPARPSGRPWVFAALLGLVLALLIGWRLLPDAPPTPPGTVATPAGVVVVELQIEGQAPQRREVPPIGGNALTVLQAASEESPAFFPEVQGEGAGAFVRSIGGIANEGSGGRNWTYAVNGRPGDRSAAITPVKDGDSVLWKFTPPE